jgi:hypothetical protein
MMYRFFFISGLILGLFGTSCYSFKGFSIDPLIETFQVVNFEVDQRASIAPATAGVDFAQRLQDKIRSETRLKYKAEESDILFEGRIKEFDVRAVAPKAGEQSSNNQLVITIQVTYTDNKNEKNNWEQSWTQFAEYGADQDLLSVQTSLIDEISKRLLEDVFNKAFNNW